MIVYEDVYLEHYGKKGMRWGVRAAKSTGRGIKKTYKFSKAYPKTTAATIVAGASFVALVFGKKGSNSKSVGDMRLQRLPREKFGKGEEYTKAMAGARDSIMKFDINKVGGIKPDPKWEEAKRITARMTKTAQAIKDSS